MASKFPPATKSIIINILTLILGLLGGSSVESLIGAPTPAPLCVCPPAAPTAPAAPAAPTPAVGTLPSE